MMIATGTVLVLASSVAAKVASPTRNETQTPERGTRCRPPEHQAVGRKSTVRAKGQSTLWSVRPGDGRRVINWSKVRVLRPTHENRRNTRKFKGGTDAAPPFLLVVPHSYPNTLTRADPANPRCTLCPSMTTVPSPSDTVVRSGLGHCEGGADVSPHGHDGGVSTRKQAKWARRFCSRMTTSVA